MCGYSIERAEDRLLVGRDDVELDAAVADLRRHEVHERDPLGELAEHVDLVARRRPSRT